MTSGPSAMKLTYICYVYCRYAESGDLRDKKRSGRKKCTTEAQDNVLLDFIRENPTVAATVAVTRIGKNILELQIFITERVSSPMFKLIVENYV